MTSDKKVSGYLSGNVPRPRVDGITWHFRIPWIALTALRTGAVQRVITLSSRWRRPEVAELFVFLHDSQRRNDGAVWNMAARPELRENVSAQAAETASRPH